MGDIAPKSVLRYRSVDDGKVLSYLTPKEAYVRNKLTTSGFKDDPYDIPRRKSLSKPVANTNKIYPEQNMPVFVRTIVQCILVVLALVIVLLLVELTYNFIVSSSDSQPCLVPISNIHMSCKHD